MKTCTKCGETKLLSDFNKQSNSSDGLASICRECNRKNTRAYVEAHREKHRLQVKEYWANRADIKREKYHRRQKTRKGMASQLLRNAVYRGKIVKPDVCECCGKQLPKSKIHGHHYDYSRPYDVIWCCSICHGKLHRQINDELLHRVELAA